VSVVCVDASLILLALLKEELSEKADRQFVAWREAGVRLIGPPLLPAEVASGLRQALHQGRISEDEGDGLLREFLQLRIGVLDPPGLVQRAWDLGKLFRPSRLYDMFYLALAAVEDCDIWTRDKRLANLVGHSFGRLRLLSESEL
jgi:predicted nucleic acid-binding protein